jgi:uncharacterized protein YecT (DUF1311 family)
MKTTMYWCAVALVVWSFPAMAGALDECMVKGDHPAVTQCLQQEESATEASLRQAETTAARKARELELVTGNTEPRSAFDKAIVAFRAYRDAQCNFVRAMYGSGSGAGQALIACRVDMTRRRIRELLN